jgi:hypothetical protein
MVLAACRSFGFGGRFLQLGQGAPLSALLFFFLLPPYQRTRQLAFRVFGVSFRLHFIVCRDGKSDLRLTEYFDSVHR